MIGLRGLEVDPRARTGSTPAALGSRRMNRRDGIAMVKRSARQAGLLPALASRIGNHTFLSNGA